MFQSQLCRTFLWERLMEFTSQRESKAVNVVLKRETQIFEWLGVPIFWGRIPTINDMVIYFWDVYYYILIVHSALSSRFCLSVLISDQHVATATGHHCSTGVLWLILYWKEGKNSWCFMQCEENVRTLQQLFITVFKMTLYHIYKYTRVE